MNRRIQMDQEEAPKALASALVASRGGANALGACIGPHEEVSMPLAPAWCLKRRR